VALLHHISYDLLLREVSITEAPVFNHHQQTAVHMCCAQLKAVDCMTASRDAL